MIIKKFISENKSLCNYMILQTDSKLYLLRELQKGEEVYYIGKPNDFFLRQFNAIKLINIKIKNVTQAEKIVKKLWGAT